ncbi:hypothetical protein Ait01nite_082420 [Actinoplanes italicus]|uniref:Uncharacterized protein n=1 Tax=Actinoplanes italicus TaxID=113567 RepID=A0A2T0K339_9ACTN|nr:hypothetical protein [Actinoplanes italicus]PRX17245.1 hypothetical protein CLV67_11621 [Actinoplanes italicus]GIE35197.1 hypothetical protein Ait01nite_082420 [Actinoplanes italicus]
MSSGGIVMLPVAVVLAAGAAVVLTAAAAAALTVWAANRAAEAALNALGRVGDGFEAEATRQEQAAIAALRWPQVVAEAVERNARIRMLSVRAGRAGVTVTLPAPLDLAGRTEQEVVAWLTQADGLLRFADEALTAGCAAKEGERLAELLPASVTRLPDTAVALERLQETLRSRHTAPVLPRPAALDVSAVLRTLDPDANEEDRIAVLRVAVLAERAEPREARMYDRQLRLDVAAANDRAAGRRLAATMSAALEDPIVATTPPPGPYSGTAARLGAVIAGDAELTPDLLTEAAGAVRWAETVVRASYLRETVSQCLAQQGYTVDTAPGGLRLTREDWYEHSAEVWVDQDGVLNGRVVRENDVDGDQAEAGDRARCDEFNDALSEVGDRLHAEVAVDRNHRPQRRARSAPDTTRIQTQRRRQA